MKLAVQALVLGICAMGASAALATSHATMSHQAVVSAIPMPTCGPSGCNGNGGKAVSAIPMPTCGPSGCNGNGGKTVAAIPMPTCGPSGCNGNGTVK